MTPDYTKPILVTNPDTTIIFMTMLTFHRKQITFETMHSDSSYSDSSHNTRNRLFKKRKSNYVSDESFATGGNLSHRLMTSKRHILKLPNDKQRCALHCWASDQKVDLFKHVYYCGDCKIQTCIPCHEILLTEHDILSKKHEIARS